MAFGVEFTKPAAEELAALRKTDQVAIIERCKTHLTNEPSLQSKSRIKKLRDDSFPPYRLRVGEFRVFYDVDEAANKVIIYGVLRKADAQDWLDQSTARRHDDENSQA